MSYVEKAELYIETNYSYPITVEDIAAYVGISRSHLFRSFQAHMGKSPKEYPVRIPDPSGLSSAEGDRLSVSTIAYSGRI